MKNKYLWIKILSILVALLPPIVVLCLNVPIFITETNKTISAALILIILFIICVFKDAVSRFFKTPSAFKLSIVIFILSYIAVTLGEQLLAISLTAAVSSAVAIPLTMVYNYKTRPATAEDMKNILDTFTKKESSDEISDEKN